MHLLHSSIFNILHLAGNLSVYKSKSLYTQNEPNKVHTYFDWRNYNKYTHPFPRPLSHHQQSVLIPASSQLQNGNENGTLSYLIYMEDDKKELEKTVNISVENFPSSLKNDEDENEPNENHYQIENDTLLNSMKPSARRNSNSRFLTTTTSTTTSKPSSDVFLNDLTWDDATWILTASFIIFTMQTGFGMLESGCVSIRNESNIMMKNVVDVVFGGLTYWLFGFSISFGTDYGSSPFLGVGEYLVDSDASMMGPVFAAFMFQLSFATTATTIVSGTMAERCNFKAYCIFSMLNTVVYCVPARWIWGPGGFLGEMGVIDIAGSGAVHLLGGVSGFIAAWMLGPRLGRYENGPKPLPLGNPTSCIVGLYILWWGWLAFNSGSTFGVSGAKWKFAARAAVTTLIASIGGGIVGSVWTLFKPGRIFEVMDIVNPVLGALVSITAGCALYRTLDAFIIGAIGGAVIILTNGVPDYFRVDDPVGATSVHAFGGLWGLVAVGIFAEEDLGLGFTKGNSGLRHGGSFFLVLVQLFAALCITVWSVIITFILLWVINKFVPIRMEPQEELMGADFIEHLVYRRHVGLSPALSVLNSEPEIKRAQENAAIVGGCNPTHETINGLIENIGVSAKWRKLKTRAMVASAFMSVLRASSASMAASTNRVRDVNNAPELYRQDKLSPVKSVDVVREYLGAPFTLINRNHHQTPEISNGNTEEEIQKSNDYDKLEMILTISKSLDKNDSPSK